MYAAQTVQREDMRRERRARALRKQREKRKMILLIVLTLVVIFVIGMGFGSMITRAKEPLRLLCINIMRMWRFRTEILCGIWQEIIWMLHIMRIAWIILMKL